MDNHGGIYLPTFSLTVSEANNRITDPGFSYDSAGNLKQQPDTPGATTYKLYTYDAESRLTELNGGAGTYVYDGDGRRVRKMVDASITTYVHNALGQLVAEYTNTSPTGNGGTSYLTADQLGSTRVVTDSNANVIARHDYLPFGEEVGEPYGGRSKRMGYDVYDSINQRFTSKERDSETGLDYFAARYFGSTMGRFASTDPVSAINFQQMQNDRARDQFLRMLGNPQSWNAYAYSFNNPLLFTDPTGEVVTSAEDVTIEINKQKLGDARKNLAEYGRQLSEDVKKGKLPSKEAVDEYYAKALELTGGGHTQTQIENALLVSAGAAFDIRGSTGNVMTKDALGIDTLHHFFINAYNNFENPVIGGLATLSQNTIFTNGREFHLGGETDPLDRNANNLGAQFGNELHSAYVGSFAATKAGIISTTPDRLRPSGLIQNPPPK